MDINPNKGHKTAKKSPSDVNRPKFCNRSYF